MNPGRLLFPAIRWDAIRGYEAARDDIERGLALGAGGFILFGGTANAAAALTTELQQRSAHPLLIGADLERGAGQQFSGATPLPPAAAIGAMDDPAVTHKAGALTAREARAIGINWIYAPVADVDLEPNNPIVGTRAFGSDAERVATHVRAWINGCHEGGALACAKHFPGHGRTTGDSHAMLPVVNASAADLEADLTPFRAAIHAGVDAIMSAHVVYPALDRDARAATLSPEILTRLLRENMQFGGLVVTDALNMAGAKEAGAGEANAGVRAVAAGCDALLYPDDPAAVIAGLREAVGTSVAEARIAEAVARIDAAARKPGAGPGAKEWGAAPDLEWAAQAAVASLSPARGLPRLPARSFDLLIIDDDVGGPFPAPARDRFPDALRRAGCEVYATATPGPDRPLVIAVYCDIRAWKGRPGCSARTIDAVRAALALREAPIILFGHPRLAADLPGLDVLGAWGGEWLMQEAAARWLTR